MATEVKQTEQTTAPVQKSAEDRFANTFEGFWQKNGKKVSIGILAVVLLVAGYFAYNNFVKAPENVKAGNAMWKAESNFRNDSFALALNGDGSAANPGFLKVISKYGGTKTANLAKFYAGACYLQIGDFNNAVKYLNDYSSTSEVLNVRVYGLLGDAYSELGKKDQAVENYKKAGKAFADDTFNSSEYLYRAAVLLADQNKTADAIALLKEIKKNFPMTPRGVEADKLMAKLGETK
ncbi:tetratricopeptide repeat protein [Pseudoflavitalea rhizosphaerae]|uniref:tetratricopeptide repeat protein n=1 Tax=Pseudoflavitalea rhizosphaerae TaxID=1884793 RepID=UPI000F8E57BB|nr:tetratricopeptide repeat protein [Pseudoflavitalea rhizosphaerae]